MIRQSGIRCLDCDDEIYSNSRHDFVTCKCGRVFIDGGFDYQRIGYYLSMPLTIYRDIERVKTPYFRDEKPRKG